MLRVENIYKKRVENMTMKGARCSNSTTIDGLKMEKK